jgi:Cu/Ag efflux pump CusA
MVCECSVHALQFHLYSLSKRFAFVWPLQGGFERIISFQGDLVTDGLTTLALLGMIAKNAVILIVQIEADRAAGLPLRDAVVAAATSRLRPMMLTALSTVLGLIPIAPTVFWGPMAFAIMGGLLVATLLTLVVLPALYVASLERQGDRKVISES